MIHPRIREYFSAKAEKFSDDDDDDDNNNNNNNRYTVIIIIIHFGSIQ
jgi:hypothetical protein